MTDFRLNVWVNTGKVAPKLNLPPTSESHKLNVLRAHFQVEIFINYKSMII